MQLYSKTCTWVFESVKRQVHDYYYFFFHSILRRSVVVSKMCRQSSRIAAFLQADARPMFCWLRSASTARSQGWLGLPNGCFQSGGSPGSPQQQHGGGPLVVSCGQYVRRAANVCQWPVGKEDGMQWLLWLPHSSHGECMVYGILRILRSAHMSNASMREHWSFVVDHISHPYNKKGLCKSGRGVSWYPAWCLTSRFFFPASSCRIELYANPTQDLTSAATRGVDHATR